MKVAVDISALETGHKVRGVGVYTKELVDALGKVETMDVEIIAVNSIDENLEGFDLVHLPYFHPFFVTLPFKKPAQKLVVTIHDVIPLIYPKHYPPGIKGTLRFQLQKYLLSRVDGIVTPSRTSKKDIVRFLGVPKEKIYVVYEAPKDIFQRYLENKRESLKKVSQKYNLPERYVLYVGDVNYNKNLTRLAEACVKQKINLVIVGKAAGKESLQTKHPETRSFRRFLDKYKNNKLINRIGFVSNDELVSIYNLSTLYCQPSLYEGFGLPVLEAMACGVPVAAARTQALVEIAEEAAVFFDPKSVRNIAKVLKRLMDSKKLRSELVKKGSELVKNYTWERSAQETVEVYRQIAND